MFYRAAGWTLLRAGEEAGPSCAVTFVKVLSPTQQLVAILGVNLGVFNSFWGCIYYAIANLAPSCLFWQQQRASSQESQWMGLRGSWWFQALNSRVFGNVRSNTVVILLKCEAFEISLAGF